MKAKFLKSVIRPEDLPEGDKPQIAFVGRSNVGKSTLINHLTGQKNLARVSAEPGRTQTVNLFDVDGRFWLVDLPGYGYAKGSKAKRQDFADILGGYLEQSKRLKMVFLIIDARIGPTEMDHDMLYYLRDNGTPVTMILNKVDKQTNSGMADLKSTLKAAYPEMELIPHSSISGIGRGQIHETIEKAIR